MKCGKKRKGVFIAANQRKCCFGSFHGECVWWDHLSEPAGSLSLSSAWIVVVWRHALISDTYQPPVMSLLCVALMFFNINIWISIFSLHFTGYDVKYASTETDFRLRADFWQSDEEQVWCGGGESIPSQNTEGKLQQSGDYFTPMGFFFLLL